MCISDAFHKISSEMHLKFAGSGLGVKPKNGFLTCTFTITIMTGKVQQLRTMTNGAAFLRETMTGIVSQLIYFSWNDKFCGFRIFQKRHEPLTDLKLSISNGTCCVTYLSHRTYKSDNPICNTSHIQCDS